MGDRNDYKPTIFMFVLQLLYAGMTLSIRAALLKGMSPRVFVVYRQAIATMIIAPITYFARRTENSGCLGWKSFWLIFLTSLIGISINQNIYFEGVYLATSSMASAMGNIVPAITFIMACLVGLEKIYLHSLRSIAKIMGTTICVGGAIFMALLKGPKILNSAINVTISNSLLGNGDEDNWLMGCLFLFGSSCCWSLWLILQIPVSTSHPDHLSLTTWLCFMGTLQSTLIALISDRDIDAWTLNSKTEVFACIYTGLSSAIAFFGQTWCIAKRGPLFPAMFNPLCTVIVTILASIFLHEEIYTGSLVGGIVVVIGLYIVLWGKAKDLEECYKDTDTKIDNNQISAVKILIYDSLEEPLLPDKSTEFHGIQRNDILVGGIVVVIGLYIVLWGKAKDLEECYKDTDTKIDNNQISAVKILIDESHYEIIADSLEKPLLPDKSTEFHGIQRDDK